IDFRSKKLVFTIPSVRLEKNNLCTLQTTKGVVSFWFSGLTHLNNTVMATNNLMHEFQITSIVSNVEIFIS
ncbi:hypothetical protein ACJX0J_026707, partial [Zea mays]